MKENPSNTRPEVVRNAVWQKLLDASIVNRYFATLWARYRVKYVTVRIFLFLFAATSGFAPFVQQFPSSLQTIIGAALLFVICLDFVQNYSVKLAALKVTCQASRALEDQWGQLWFELDAGRCSLEEAWERNKQLTHELQKILQWPAEAMVKPNEEVNESCTQLAYNDAESRYATASPNN